LRARATAAVGGVPAVVVELFLRGRPGWRVTVGVGCGVCGAPVGVTAAALAMAASTSGRYLMRFRVPGWRPFGFGRLMLKVGGGDPGALGGGGFGRRMVELMTVLYVGGRM
jgi:hypothetical protein